MLEAGIDPATRLRRAVRVQLRLLSYQCRLYFKWAVATVLQSVQIHRLFFIIQDITKGRAGSAETAFLSMPVVF